MHRWLVVPGGVSPAGAAVLLWSLPLGVLCWQLLRAGLLVGLAPLGCSVGFFASLRAVLSEPPYHQLLDGPAGTPCPHCGLPHGPATSYCSSCARCLHLRDHHCELLQTCVHHGNRQAYIRLLVFGVLGLTAQLLALLLAAGTSDRLALRGWVAESGGAVGAAAGLSGLGLVHSLMLAQQLEVLGFLHGVFWIPGWLDAPLMQTTEPRDLISGQPSPAPPPWAQIKGSQPQLGAWIECGLLAGALCCVAHVVLVGAALGFWIVVLGCTLARSAADILDSFLAQ